MTIMRVMSSMNFVCKLVISFIFIVYFNFVNHDLSSKTDYNFLFSGLLVMQLLPFNRICGRVPLNLLHSPLSKRIWQEL